MGGSASRREVAGGNGDAALLTEGVERGGALQEAVALTKLTIPIFIMMVSWVCMKVTDTAVLGHSGTRYLDATALSDLWTSSSGVFIQSRVVGTFCGQAFGAKNFRLVGIWLQVSYVVLFSMMVPVAVLWCLTETVLRALGKSDQAASDAGYYAMVLAVCLPVRIGFSQLSTFFSSQAVMRPGAVCAFSAMGLNLFGNLVLVLGLGIPGWSGFGFPVCPWVTVTVEFIQLSILWYVYCHRKKLHIQCWPGWSMEHITRERVIKYVKMYLPQALSIGSDFWRVAAIGAIASSMGDINLGVFNASYRICWMCLTFMGALASAVGTRLNLALGRGSTANAKLTVTVGTAIALMLLMVLGLVVVCIPRWLGSIFSDDPAVLDLFEMSRWSIAAFAILMNLAVNLEKIPQSAGRVNTIFYAGLAGSWLGQVPGVILCTRFWRNDLIGLFSGVAGGYGLLVLIYVAVILALDWEQVAIEARERSEVSSRPPETNSVSLEPVQEGEGTGAP